MAETSPQTTTDPPDRKGRTRVFLSHPVVVGTALALISGLIASVLFPAMTRSWQDRPRELALKRELVTDISEASTNAISRGNTFAYRSELERTSKAERIQNLTRELSDWEIASSVIGSQLATYFGETTLPRQWAAYQSAVLTYVEYTSQANNKLTEGLSFALLEHFRSVRFDDPQQEQERKETISSADELLDEDAAKPGPPDEDAPEPVADADPEASRGGDAVADAAPAGDGVADAAPGRDASVTEDPVNRLAGLYLLSYERDQIASRILEAEAAGFSHGFSILGD